MLVLFCLEVARAKAMSVQSFPRLWDFIYFYRNL